VRVDYQLGAHHQLSGMYFESRGTADTPTTGGNQVVNFAGMETYEGQYDIVASDIWTLAPTRVNSVRAVFGFHTRHPRNVSATTARVSRLTIANPGSHSIPFLDFGSGNSSAWVGRGEGGGWWADVETVPLLGAVTNSIGAMNRYPRRGNVSTKRGFSAESPNAALSFMTAEFKPRSESTKVSAGHNARQSSSRVITWPGRSTSITKILNG